jgi:hypothetical protein
MKTARPLLAAAFLLSFTVKALAAPVYHVTYLGFSFTNGIAAKINNSGQITGNDGSKGFLYTNGQFTTIPTFRPAFGSE